MWVDAVREVLVALCVCGAVALSVSAGVGMLRFRDSLGRLHAATKPQIFGLLLMLLAVAFARGDLLTLLWLLPVFAFQALTAPVSAHMVARSAYRSGLLRTEELAMDELAPAVDDADANFTRQQRG